MKAAKKDSDLIVSILVHFGADKVRFDPDHLKLNRSVITLPTAWHFKPMTEMDLELQLPTGKKGKTRPIQCRGIILDCRPMKQKGRYHVDLFLTDLHSSHASSLKKIVSAASAT